MVFLFIQEARVKRVNEDMLERGRKHAAVLKTREEQFMRYLLVDRSYCRAIHDGLCL